MKCCIEIDLHSDAFRDYGGGQLADMLRDFAEHLEEAGFGLRDLDRPLRDRDGKTCGRATVEMDVDEHALADMVGVLESHGERFVGDHAGDMAQGWIDRGFDAADADGWCLIGCWEPTVASQLRDAGKTPAQVAAAVDSLIEDAGGGSPTMYLSPASSIRVLIAACK